MSLARAAELVGSRSATKATPRLNPSVVAGVVCAAIVMLLSARNGWAQGQVLSSDSVESLEITLEEIIEVWRERRSRIRSLVIEWEGEMTYGKGSLFWSPGKVALHGGDETKLPRVPPSDVTFRTSGDLVWDRDQRLIKLRHNPPTWDAERGRHFQQDLIYCKDAHLSTSFRGRGASAPLEMRGHIRERGDDEELPKYVEFNLLVTSLFPFGDPLSPVVVENEWRLFDCQIVFNGASCLVLEKRISNFERARTAAESRERLLVSPAMDFSVVQHSYVTDKGLVLWQRQFEYSRKEPNGWLPIRWTSLVAQKDQKLHQRIDQLVTKCVVNPSVAAERALANFPIDTWVKDETTDTEWIVRTNGRRLITQAELDRGATHAELIATRSGKAKGAPAHWRPYAVIAIGVGACCAYSVFRRRGVFVSPSR